MARGAEHSELLALLNERLPGLLAVYGFGSSGTEDEHAGSDLDLAVYAGRSLPVAELWFLAQELAVLAGKDVDLVDLVHASTVMRAQVVAYGERLYCSNEAACESFEDLAYWNYVRLQEERREILEDVRVRGSVYGR